MVPFRAAVLRIVHYVLHIVYCVLRITYYLLCITYRILPWSIIAPFRESSQAARFYFWRQLCRRRGLETGQRIFRGKFCPVLLKCSAKGLGLGLEMEIGRRKTHDSMIFVGEKEEMENLSGFIWMRFKGFIWMRGRPQLKGGLSGRKIQKWENWGHSQFDIWPVNHFFFNFWNCEKFVPGIKPGL